MSEEIVSAEVVTVNELDVEEDTETELALEEEEAVDTVE